MKLVLVKKHTAAVFGPRETLPLGRGVEKLLTGGSITSGCARVSAPDAAQQGRRTVPVGDMCVYGATVTLAEDDVGREWE